MKCLHCKHRPRASKHFNTKYCAQCRAHLISRPKSTLSLSDRKRAAELIGKMPREQICEEIGCSLANLKRAFRGTRLAYYNHLSRNPQLVKQICAYYEKHGRKKTQERFPEVKIRSVIERYKFFKPRQIRWTDKQIIEAVKMSGLVSLKSQARFFARPRANKGSIRSLWSKRFGFNGCMHGMSYCQGVKLVNRHCPTIKLKYRRIFLWVDMEAHLRQGLPSFIREAIRTLADFQRWVFQSENPRAEIFKIMKERK